MNFWQKIWSDPKTTIPGIIAAVLSTLVAQVVMQRESLRLQVM